MQYSTECVLKVVLSIIAGPYLKILLFGGHEVKYNVMVHSNQPILIYA